MTFAFFTGCYLSRTQTTRTTDSSEYYLKHINDDNNLYANLHQPIVLSHKMTTQTLPTKSQALVAEEMGAPFELVGIDLPSEEELHEDDVLVRFHASGICHTDIGSWSGAIPAPFPCILGHEGAGEVLAIGKRNKDQFRIGDHVVASFCSCGDCKACKRNEPACCEIFVAINLGLMDKTLNSVKISYTNKSNEIKQAHAKYFGQSSFGNVMAVTGRSVSEKVL